VVSVDGRAVFPFLSQGRVCVAVVEAFGLKIMGYFIVLYTCLCLISMFVLAIGLTFGSVSVLDFRSARCFPCYSHTVADLVALFCFYLCAGATCRCFRSSPPKRLEKTLVLPTEWLLTLPFRFTRLQERLRSCDFRPDRVHRRPSVDFRFSVLALLQPARCAGWSVAQHCSV